ncbi:MAG: YggT family protein [Thermomicrobium sp.]|nr:YggT family protein [Thermomicrobium sp.]
MPPRVFEGLNWILAILMWLVIGRALLDWLTRGRVTVIGRLFELLTEPLYRPCRYLFPRASRLAIAVTLVTLLLVARVALFLAFSPSR